MSNNLKNLFVPAANKRAKHMRKLKNTNAANAANAPNAANARRNAANAANAANTANTQASKKWNRLMFLLESVINDQGVQGDKKRQYIRNLIDIYIKINERRIVINRSKINNFIKLLIKIVKDKILKGELQKCLFNSKQLIEGNIIIIRHSETYENLFHHKAITASAFNKIKYHVELLEPYYRNSPVTCVGKLMIESSQQQLANDKSLQDEIKKNFPIVIRSEKKRTHETGDDILKAVTNYNPLKFDLFMFNEKDPQTLLKMPEYYRLSRIMIACIPTDNLIIIGHSGWFRDFFNQTKDPSVAIIINPTDDKMYNAQALLYKYTLPINQEDIMSRWGKNYLKDNFNFTYEKCLFKPDMTTITNDERYNSCLEKNQEVISTKKHRRNVHEINYGN